MFTLVTEKNKAVLRGRAFRGLIVSLALAAAGAVYEAFGHGVWSFAMVYAFMIPLAGVTLLSMLLERSRSRVMPGELPVLLWHMGLAALTTGSLFGGALEIYGTTSRLLSVYWVIGGALAAAGAVTGLAGVKTAAAGR